MKRSLSEKKVLKKLGIVDFRHMTKDKVVKFASMLPYLDTEVAKKALDQFPCFKEMAVEIVKEYSNVYLKELESNEASQQRVYSLIEEVMQTLNKELQSDEITEEGRERIENKLLELVRLAVEFDKTNKKYHESGRNRIAVLLLFLGVGAAAVLGANIQGKQGDNNDDDVADIDYIEK